MSEAEFELCEPFGIDDGELEGLTNTKCFVLGVEWAQVRKLMGDYLEKKITGFCKPVH